MRYGLGSPWQRHNDRGNPSSDTASQASLRALAQRYGINQKTGAKWKRRVSVADVPTGPKDAKLTVLSVAEETIIAAFCKHTLLPFSAVLSTTSMRITCLACLYPKCRSAAGAMALRGQPLGQCHSWRKREWSDDGRHRQDRCSRRTIHCNPRFSPTYLRSGIPHSGHWRQATLSGAADQAGHRSVCQWHSSRFCCIIEACSASATNGCNERSSR
jgi:hypothetical protein